MDGFLIDPRARRLVATASMLPLLALAGLGLRATAAAVPQSGSRLHL